MRMKLAMSIAAAATAATLVACDDSTSASSEPVPASSASDVISSSTSQENPAGISSAVEETSSSVMSESSSSELTDASIESSSSVQKGPNKISGVCGDLWCGYTDIDVRTGYEDKYETSGNWYLFDDNVGPYNGDSKISLNFDVEPPEYSSYIPVSIEENGGLLGSVTLGTAYEYPFAGLGFNIVSEEQQGADITDWGGVCLVYSSTVPFSVELGVEDEAMLADYRIYEATVAKSAALQVVDIPWTEFKREKGWGPFMSLSDVLKIVAAVKIKFTNSSGDFYLASIGRYGTCGKEASVPASSASTSVSSSASEQMIVNDTFLWKAPDAEGKVVTGSPEETSGYWYDYTDSYQYGNSEIIYPSDVEMDENGNFYGPLSTQYDGIKAEVKIDDAYESPFAGFGFNIWSENQEGKDISKWGGFCLTYSSTGPFYIELGLQSEADLTEYSNFQSSVSASETVTTVNVPWSKFMMRAGWGCPGDCSLEKYIDKVAAVKLRFEKSSNFLLKEIGSLNACGK